MASSFNGAHHFVIENSVINIDNTVTRSAPANTTSLNELHSRIAAGAIHDSSERCDAPKCHPETRVAVQDEIYSWIVHGDQDPQPTKIKWVTGPAGSGKTSIMGSLSEKCSSEGLLGGSFFFSSSSPSFGCRSKKAFVLTLAYQLAQHHPGLKSVIAHVVEKRPEVFQKNLHAQMKLLILGPLQEAHDYALATSSKSVVIIDGVDECELEPTSMGALNESDPKVRTQMRSREDDQLEILQVLLQAASNPSFPFRILIASRPERVFRHFFEAGPFAPTLTLDENYNPDADIALFLEAKFAEIRRDYKLSASWPPPHTIPLLVKKASGQFIYAATVIRFITESRKHNPYTLLRIVLAARLTDVHSGLTPDTNLDALYTKILQSSPDPGLSVRWLWVINGGLSDPASNGLVGKIYEDIYGGLPSRPPAQFINRLLESFDGEAEHLLGDLHSLVKVPSLGDELKTPYSFHHKSLFDFLGDPNRCGSLFLAYGERSAFFWKKYFDVCRSKGFSVPGREDALHLSIYFRLALRLVDVSSMDPSDFDLPPSNIDWWVRNSVSGKHDIRVNIPRLNIRRLFNVVHNGVSAIGTTVEEDADFGVLQFWIIASRRNGRYRAGVPFSSIGSFQNTVLQVSSLRIWRFCWTVMTLFFEHSAT
ncbi:hypothetical protein H1R20_g12245, partial [Candolleomyces eurysporus]